MRSAVHTSCDSQLPLLFSSLRGGASVSAARHMFCFYGYGAHRDLHSFPTRRSSDLDAIVNRDGWVIWGTPNCGKGQPEQDRKSTRLNSSHLGISYAVFCLKKKNIGDAFSVAVSRQRDDLAALDQHRVRQHMRFQAYR